VKKKRSHQFWRGRAWKFLNFLALVERKLSREKFIEKKEKCANLILLSLSYSLDKSRTTFQTQHAWCTALWLDSCLLPWSSLLPFISHFPLINKICHQSNSLSVAHVHVSRAIVYINQISLTAKFACEEIPQLKWIERNHRESIKKILTFYLFIGMTIPFRAMT